MNDSITINGRKIGHGQPVYLVAELSANHHQDLQLALDTVRAAKESGADAIKVQTYTADTITIRSDQEHFKIQGGTLWDGKTLHDLYGEAHLPWEWHENLQALAHELKLDFFSSPFDFTAVDFLENLSVPAYKIASFELVDLPLIRKVARTGKPVIMSTGMAGEDEVAEALRAARGAGAAELMLLKCTSAYPAPFADMHLRTLPDMVKRFGVPVGLSDHTTGSAIPVAAVALGASLVEKHFILDRSAPGPDSAFSLEPSEFAQMVKDVRDVEAALGEVHYSGSSGEASSKVFRRSLFVVEDIAQGEALTERNVRSIRPGHGLHTRHYEEVLGKRALRDIKKGTPLSWDLLQQASPQTQSATSQFEEPKAGRA